MAKTITARVTDRVAKRLAKESKEREKTQSQLVEWALEQFLFDPDEGLELRPEVAKRLKKPVDKKRLLSHKEFWSRVLR
ncbi:MAG: hypothetical protein HY961_09515 [Ignavibacteriae bacterium]|nr:hypothetical protein [Ignavibacteriota bacterium]